MNMLLGGMVCFYLLIVIYETLIAKKDDEMGEE